MNVQKLRAYYELKMDEWFHSLKVGDKVYNYALKWQNGDIIEKKLREGIIKEIHDGRRFDRYLVVDNLTTGRQNKWHDFDIVKPPEIEALSERLIKLNTITADELAQGAEQPEPTIDEKQAQAAYEQLVEQAAVLLKDKYVRLGKCSGIYGAFNKKTDECIYIGKSRTSIGTRWREHARFWKRFRPIHKQPLLTKYLHFFSDQIEWRVLLPIEGNIDNDLLEFCERRLFEKYRPIANSIIPNGTYFGRSVLESEGDLILVSEWNPTMVEIRIRKGQFNGFSDGKDHFEYTVQQVPD